MNDDTRAAGKLPRLPDELETFGGKVVRVSTLPPKTRIRIARDVWITADQVPLVAVRLSCNCRVRGIALAKRDVVFCEKHKDDGFVREVLA